MMQTNREFHEPKQGKRRKSVIVLRKREAHGEDLRTSYIGWNTLPMQTTKTRKQVCCRNGKRGSLVLCPETKSVICTRTKSIAQS
jgi:hypothetical protein